MFSGHNIDQVSKILARLGAVPKTVQKIALCLGSVDVFQGKAIANSIRALNSLNNNFFFGPGIDYTGAIAYLTSKRPAIKQEVQSNASWKKTIFLDILDHMKGLGSGQIDEFFEPKMMHLSERGRCHLIKFLAAHRFLLNRYYKMQLNTGKLRSFKTR